jgi:hypothetical protein
MGPVLEFTRSGDGGVHFGLQGSAWMAALVGFDLRFRHVGGRSTPAFGTFAKAGALILGRDAPTDE